MIKIVTTFIVGLLFSAQLFGQGTETGQLKILANNPSGADSIGVDTSIVEGKEVLHSRRANGLKHYGIDIEGIYQAGPNYSNRLYSVFPNLPMLHFNRVNGFFLGVKKERMQWQTYENGFLDIPNIQLHGMLGYATGLSEWQYTFGLEKPIGKKRHLMIGGELFNAAGTDDHWRVGLNETSLTAFVGGYDFLDYYKQNGWGTYLLVRGNRFWEGGLAFTNSQYNTLNRSTGWALVGAGNRYRENPPIQDHTLLNNNDDLTTEADNAEIASVYLSASFNRNQHVFTNRFTFSFSGTVEFADPGIGVSDYTYSKYTGELITYLNFEPGGMLKHRLRTSAITGTAPDFKQLYLGGIGTMRALPYKSMGSGNQMLLSNLELQFGHPEYSDEGWIDFDDFYLSLFLDTGWVNQSEENPSADFDLSDLKNNAGLGLGTNIIRTEVAWDLDRPGRTPVLWIRLNPTF